MSLLLLFGDAAAAPAYVSLSPRVRDTSRLSVLVTHADGRTSRWGPDELSAEDVPASITFGSSNPGGFKTANLTLPRRVDRDYPDEALYDDVKILGPGGQVAWEGRVAELPREQGQGQSVSVNCVGWSAHLKDDASFREIYVDRDLGQWTNPPSDAQQVALLALSPQYVFRGAPSVTWGATTPVLTQQFDTIFGDASTRWYMDGWYTNRGIPIGSIYYSCTAAERSGTTFTGTSWIVQLRIVDDDVPTAADDTTDLGAGGSGTLTATTEKKFAHVRMYYDANIAWNDTYGPWWTKWSTLVVFGAHGLTKYGTAPNEGLLASDVITNVIQRAAPLLNVTSTSVTPTSFVIPQLVFSDPTTPEDVILRANAFHNYRWGVWENRTFTYKPADDSLTWPVRLADGASLSLEGDSGEGLFNGVVVRYTEPDGQQRVVGPTGYTPADATDSSLLDSSASNPVNAHGIPRRYAILDLSTVTTQAGAIAIGAAWLAEKLLPQRRGQITVRGMVEHPTEGPVPAWRVRAGDWVRVSDRPGDVAREIQEVAYDHSNRTATLSVGRTFALEAILERIAVVTGVVT